MQFRVQAAAAADADALRDRLATSIAEPLRGNDTTNAFAIVRRLHEIATKAHETEVALVIHREAAALNAALLAIGI